MSHRAAVDLIFLPLKSFSEKHSARIDLRLETSSYPLHIFLRHVHVHSFVASTWLIELFTEQCTRHNSCVSASSFSPYDKAAFTRSSETVLIFDKVPCVFVQVSIRTCVFVLSSQLKAVLSKEHTLGRKGRDLCATKSEYHKIRQL